VVCVAWQDASDYAAWLSRKTGQDYQLPSDSEWEYAARAGTTSVYFWGDDRELGCAYANGCDQSMKRVFPPDFPAIYSACDDGAVFTTPARHYKPNGFGLFDMTGNVWEWVLDCNEATYESLPSNGLPRTAERCPQRDVRGGSWDDDPEDLRNASRHHTAAGNRQLDLGFRLTRRIPRN
jgi:formylglycine-generating enzyme required for sulfatase activity